MTEDFLLGPDENLHGPGSFLLGPGNFLLGPDNGLRHRPRRRIIPLGHHNIYEQPRVIEQRHQYLRRMRRNREERRPEVFLDETWTNSHAAPEKLWVDRDGTGGWRRPSGKGERLIIVHAGSSYLLPFYTPAANKPVDH